ncbi:hypothetical protein EXE58_10475 [Nocardioides seonyuensis]|uniref:Nucleotidyltransferase family protein n=1 Tax=Nocardioides seonyuensis TaxID=2518371 RepID=A0A4P7IIY4_9ACTN|nr:nucleotidyltransferase family protein [Nocardioides seonyuensis]QBX55841.1 hypothetical protein EXE58_10475 [Nocardioides seonyuensis]
MRVRRGFVRDVFSEGGRTAVFVNDQVLVLSEMATVIFDATPAEATTTLEDITSAVVAEFGEPAPPTDATEATRLQVLDLVAHRVLQDGSGVAHEAFTAASVETLRQAMRHLVSDDPTPWRLPDAMSGQFVGAMRRHRLTETVARSLDRFDLPPAVAAQVSADCASERVAIEDQAEELHEILSALHEVGVRALTFKGLALAAQAHGDFRARGRGDHDLLVDPEDLSRAHDTLISLGWVPVEGFARPGDSWAWRHLVRHYYEVPLARGTSSVDLHWHLGPVRSAFPSFDTLWGRRAMVPVGGRDVPTFSSYDALTHSATHAAKDHWSSLRSVLDIRRLMSDPDAWRSADRPLRQDQLLSIGIAAHLLGTPTGAPEVVARAADLARALVPAVEARQSRMAGFDLTRRLPGAALAATLQAIARAGGRPGDFWRELWLLAIPVSDVSADPTPRAAVAVPRALGRRSAEVGRLWGRAAVERLRHTSRTRGSGSRRAT